MLSALVTLLMLAASPQDVDPGGGFDAAATGPIDADRAAAHFAEAERLSALDDGALWGRPLAGPMLFVDPRTRTVVANHRDGAGRLAPVPGRDGLFAGTLDADVPIGNTATDWAGERWSMVIWPVGPPGPGSGTLLMHESFHRLQPDLRIPLAAPENHHLDSADGRIWLRLECRALALALEEVSDTSSGALNDALLFRAQRHALFGERAAGEERALELNEGLAEYTGLRLGGLDPAGVRARAIAALARLDESDGVVRSFAYATGPAYGLLLDEALEGWRRRVRHRTDLAGLLAQATRFRAPRNPGALAEAARARGAAHALDEVERSEDAREMARQDRLDELRARYVDGPRLVLPIRGGFNYSFNPYDMEAVDGHGTFYGTMQATGRWGTLTVTGGVLLADAGRGRRALVVPAPTEAPQGRTLRGEGWTLELADGAELQPGDRAGDVVAR